MQPNPDTIIPVRDCEIRSGKFFSLIEEFTGNFFCNIEKISTSLVFLI